MKTVLLCLAFCVLAAGQLAGMEGLINLLRDHFQAQGTGEGDTVATLNGWRLEYHYGGDHHILLFIKEGEVQGQRFCYVIEVAPSWEPLLKDHTNMQRIAEEIYALLHSPGHVQHPLRPTDLATDYNHFDAAGECKGHSTYDVPYTPSFAS